MHKYKIAIAGVTGIVGQEMFKLLEERNFPYSSISALASYESIGKEITFNKRIGHVEDLATYDFRGADIALFALSDDLAKHYVNVAIDAGCKVIDNSSYFRLDESTPLIIPEVNIANIKKDNYVIANPNCVVIQLAIALAPLHRAFNIKNIVISTYQSVSGAGKKAIDELINQSQSIISNNQVIQEVFPRQIAFNVIPQCADFSEDMNTTEEKKIINELHKIISQDISISVTCVRVPVSRGHSASVWIDFEHFVTLDEVQYVLDNLSGVKHASIANDYMTPLENAGKDEVYISRLRKDNVFKNGVNMWITSDNIRKGAALNAVQIAEYLVENKMVIC